MACRKQVTNQHLPDKTGSAEDENCWPDDKIDRMPDSRSRVCGGVGLGNDPGAVIDDVAPSAAGNTVIKWLLFADCRIKRRGAGADSRRRDSLRGARHAGTVAAVA